MITRSLWSISSIVLLVQKFNRTTHLIYYDVTNFFFEIEHPDEDVINEDGVYDKRFKKNGRLQGEQEITYCTDGVVYG